MNAQQAFDDNAKAWDAYTQSPPGRLRDELNYRYLTAHLPEGVALRILDIGSGTGNLGIRLAQLGHYVTLVDFSPEMLAIARDNAQSTGLDKHIKTIALPAERLSELDERPFDVVICHTLLEYVEQPESVLKDAVSHLRHGSLLSVVVVNAYAEPLVAALGKQDIGVALSVLQGAQPTKADLFGLPRRTFQPDFIRDILLSDSGLYIVSQYGVRVIADYASDESWKNDAAHFSQMVELEQALSTRYPYCDIGRYTQIIAVK